LAVQALSNSIDVQIGFLAIARSCYRSFNHQITPASAPESPIHQLLYRFSNHQIAKSLDHQFLYRFLNHQFLLVPLLILLLSVFAGAQVRGVVPTQQKPSLKRDRTQRLVYPKIIQHEDERNANEELIDMLALPHAGLKHRAILALGRIGYPSGLTALLDRLNTDRDSETRALAAFSLGLIGSQYAVAPLMDRLGTENETAEVRARVAEALGRIASNKVAASALGKYGVDSITRALVHLLPGGTEPVSPDQKLVVSLTLSALIRLKDPSTVAAITPVLNCPDADLRPLTPWQGYVTGSLLPSPSSYSFWATRNRWRGPARRALSA
jgi:hypothetical protein